MFIKDEFHLVKVSDLAPTKFYHFQGQKKPIPPDIQIHRGLPFVLLQQLHNQVLSAVNLNLV